MLPASQTNTNAPRFPHARVIRTTDRTDKLVDEREHNAVADIADVLRLDLVRVVGAHPVREEIANLLPAVIGRAQRCRLPHRIRSEERRR